MELSESLQGVVCYCVDRNASLDETIYKILDLTSQSDQYGIQCRDLLLNNKYYKATIQLFDLSLLSSDEDARGILDSCHAVILYGDGQKMTVEQLDEKRDQLANIGGEPRILLCHGIDEDCGAYKTLQEWCISHGYDLLLTSDESVKSSIIDSLSAYRWPHRSDSGTVDDRSNGKHCENRPTGGTTSKNDPNLGGSNDDRQLDGELMKKLVDFDSLLNKLSTYRDNPELRGNPNDKNIEEIAEILSGLLGDDVDNFLAENHEVLATSNTSETNS